MVRNLLPALLVSLAFAQDDLERVFHFNRITQARSLQEAATIVRAITDIKELQVDADQHAIIFRGSAAQGALADWLMSGIDLRSNNRPAFTAQLDPDDGENIVKMFDLKNTNVTQDLYEMATLVRSITGIRRLFVYTPEPSLTVRSTAGHVAMAEWLVTWLDQPTSGPAIYANPGAADDTIRLFHMPKADTPQALQKLAVRMRTEARLTRIFTYSSRRIIAARGTKAQLAQAAQLTEK